MANVQTIPIIVKCFEEVLKTPWTNRQEQKERGKNKTTQVDISIDEVDATFRVRNDGRSIPIEKTDQSGYEGMYVPQMIFGVMNAGSNFFEGTWKASGRTAWGSNWRTFSREPSPSLASRTSNGTRRSGDGTKWTRTCPWIDASWNRPSRKRRKARSPRSSGRYERTLSNSTTRGESRTSPRRCATRSPRVLRGDAAARLPRQNANAGPQDRVERQGSAVDQTGGVHCVAGRARCHRRCDDAVRAPDRRREKERLGPPVLRQRHPHLAWRQGMCGTSATAFETPSNLPTRSTSSPPWPSQSAFSST